MCNLSSNPNSSLEKDNSLNHSCVSPKMGLHVSSAVILKTISILYVLYVLALQWSWKLYTLCITRQVPVEGKSSLCLICLKYRIIILVFYHYQPGSNITIVYCKHITHARMHAHACMHMHARACARTHIHTHTPPSPWYRLVPFVLRPTVTARSAP